MQSRFLALSLVTTTLFVAPAFAQEEGMIAVPPNFVPQNVYSTKDPNADPNTYSTKPPSSPGTAVQPATQLPWGGQTLSPSQENRQMPVQQPRAPMSAPQARYPAGYMPFGKASPEATVQVPNGPRDVTAAPVDDVGITSGELPPPSAPAAIPLPPKDPTEPTAQTAPIFEADDGVGVRHVTLRGLNKVTAEVSDIEGPVGTVLRFGNLEVIPKSCRASAKSSRPDYAALLEIRELKPNEQPTDLFSGWMYASSPSLMALEHPVYDITVVKCTKGDSDAPEEAKKPDEKKPAKK